MRHLKSGNSLGVTPSHRKALMRNLVTSLIEHGKIKTTLTRAKSLKSYADKLITLAKKGDLHAKRQARKHVTSKDAFVKLFSEYGFLCANRNGGYTRIYKTINRLGDNAAMAYIEFVDKNQVFNDITDNEPKAPIKKSSESNISGIRKELLSDNSASKGFANNIEMDSTSSILQPKDKP